MADMAAGIRCPCKPERMRLVRACFVHMNTMAYGVPAATEASAGHVPSGTAEPGRSPLGRAGWLNLWWVQRCPRAQRTEARLETEGHCQLIN